MAQGKARCYIPTRFCAHDELVSEDTLNNPHYAPNELSLLEADDAPLSDQELPEQIRFPLQYPIGEVLQRQRAAAQPARPTMRIKLAAHPICTSPTSVTATANAIGSLSERHRLHQVRRCREFWTNVKSYAYEHGPINTFESSPQNIAEGYEQLIAICQLHGILGKSSNQKVPIVNGEPAVQDVIRSQLLDCVDALLQSRYINNSGAGQLGGPPDGAYLPMWGRAVPANHTATTDKNRRAGFPDFILFPSTRQYDHAAVMEIKTWWSYTTQVLRRIFAGEDVGILTDNAAAAMTNLPPAQGGGYFNWHGENNSSKILQQIWGQLHFFKVDWGAWTNGKDIILFVITDKYNDTQPGSCNQLTFSDPIALATPDDVLYGFIGFCFASLDSNSRFNPRANDEPDLKEIICPPHLRLNPLEHPIPIDD